jgi:DNA-binding NarL/FixJ family response regulator
VPDIDPGQMTEDRPTRVLLADDHTMFREGLARLLTSYGGLEVVGETTNDDGAVALAREKKPDVVIMQAQMPFERARETLDKIRAVEPPPKVIIVTMFEDPGLMREFLRLEVGGYVLKSSSSAHLVGAVRAAVFSPEEGNVVVGMPRAMLEESKGGSEGVLSVRELEILLLVARGLSNRQIASRVHLAEGTVKRHLANTYHKMKVGSRGEAVRKALFEEWITVGEITEEEGGA